MVSHDLACSTVTKQIAFDRQGLDLTPKFKHAMDRCCQAQVSKLETLDPSLLPNWVRNIIPCLGVKLQLKVSASSKH